jgi:catechol 2,3-dioxygenase-like lactoylglutathione lyase family enzyme
MTATPRPATFGIVVADMAASLAFYRRLGLDIPAAADAEPHVHHDLAPGLALAWDTEATILSFDPSWRRPTGSPQMSIGFDCGTPAAVDKTFAALIEAGYDGHLEPWDAFWGMRYATVHDPDGNGVDLYALLPTS